MQIGYGVMRRLNTANLSESVSVDTVSTALKGGLEWGNGFTQFPLDFTVDEADERTGTVEVTVLDTSSANELELLSNGQIQAAALATNALLNDKIDRVVYNVHAYIDEDSNIQHDSFRRDRCPLSPATPAMRGSFATCAPRLLTGARPSACRSTCGEGVDTRVAPSARQWFQDGSVSVDTVSTALKGGLEWGNGFTQFPLDFTVDEADERTGTVEVTVLDTSSANELELLSNGQIQAARDACALQQDCPLVFAHQIDELKFGL